METDIFTEIKETLRLKVLEEYTIEELLAEIQKRTINMPFKESLVQKGLDQMIAELQKIRDNHNVYPQRVSIPIHEEGSKTWLRISVEMAQYDESETEVDER